MKHILLILAFSPFILYAIVQLIQWIEKKWIGEIEIDNWISFDNMTPGEGSRIRVRYENGESSPPFIFTRGACKTNEQEFWCCLIESKDRTHIGVKITHWKHDFVTPNQ